MNDKELKLGKYKQQEGVFQGEVIKYQSYTPENLNKPFVWEDKQINVLLEEATRQLGELNAYSELIPDIDIFIQMHILKEATISSKIEGTKTSIDEAVLSEEDIPLEKRDDWEEVQNYIKAIKFSITELKKIPVSQRLIKNIHKILLEGVRGKNKNPGEYRRIQNWIGASSIEYAAFIPPSFNEIEDLLHDIEQFWHNESLEIPQLIKIALFHYQFETIHPFLDGNGRIGRLLITLQLIDKEYLSKPTLYLSDFFEKNRETYYEMFRRTIKEDNPDIWIKFFLKGVKETAIKGKLTFKKIISLKDKCSIKISLLGSKKIRNAQLLLNLLFSAPVVDATKAAKYLDCSYNTASSLINDFVKAGILKEFSKKQRDKKYIFEEYIKLF